MTFLKVHFGLLYGFESWIFHPNYKFLYGKFVTIVSKSKLWCLIGKSYQRTFALTIIGDSRETIDHLLFNCTHSLNLWYLVEVDSWCVPPTPFPSVLEFYRILRLKILSLNAFSSSGAYGRREIQSFSITKSGAPDISSTELDLLMISGSTAYIWMLVMLLDFL